MADNRSKLGSPKHWQNKTKPRDRGKYPQGIKKLKAQEPTRRSARLNLGPSDHSVQPYQAKKTLARSTSLPPRGQKRSREVKYPPTDVAIEPSTKRPRASTDFAAARPTDRVTPSSEAETPLDAINYWLKEQAWPKEYFKPDSMENVLARKRSTPSLRRKRSESSLDVSSTTPSDQKPREEKSAPYRDTRYETLLATKGSFMLEDKQGPKKESKDLCRDLLAKDQEVPSISRFSDSVFKSTCNRIQNRNEAKVILDITRLIVPSAEELADFGAEHLECLIESVNEGWNNSMPLTSTRPQPDYSVGFKREAFTKEQLEKLAPFIGDFIGGDQSFLMATYYMYFPFLTCEIKCGAAALDIADRQNAHSMTLAVRAVVELFRLVKREAEIDRKILAFSVSHDHTSVRIYGHYPVIEGNDIKYYRHAVHKFDFTTLDGREKWIAYKFTKNIYDVWMPTHFKRLCSVIDALPKELDFGVAPLPQDSGLSQELGSHHLSQSFAESASQTGEESRSGCTTLNTSFTQGASKRSRRKEGN